MLLQLFDNLVAVPINFHTEFQLARSRAPIDPVSDTIFYAITQPGTPVTAPVILVAPKITAAVPLAFSYIPSLGLLTKDSVIPIPGEADNACLAWTVAYARAKEREDRSPDPSWIAVYATEKEHLLQSLGLREYQEPEYASAMWSEYW